MSLLEDSNDRRVHRYSLRAPLADVDHAGCVYFAKLFHYFQLAYKDWLHAVGSPLQYAIDEERHVAPVVESAGRFARPVRYGDLIKVRAWVSHPMPARLRQPAIRCVGS